MRMEGAATREGAARSAARRARVRLTYDGKGGRMYKSAARLEREVSAARGIGKVPISEIDNPPISVLKLTVPRSHAPFRVHVVQDGYLMAGTKQRVAVDAVRNLVQPGTHTVMYTGIYYGFGAVATAFAAKRLGLRCEVFVAALRPEQTRAEMEASRQVTTMRALGARVNLYDDYYAAKRAQYAKADADPGCAVMPLGLVDDAGFMERLLAVRLREAAAGVAAVEGARRIWVVSGSGGVAAAVHIAFPHSMIMVLPTGGAKHRARVRRWANGEAGVTAVREDRALWDSTDVVNHYDSVADYDAQLWPYVKKYGREGDVIWNVASDVPPRLSAA